MLISHIADVWEIKEGFSSEPCVRKDDFLFWRQLPCSNRHTSLMNTAEKCVNMPCSCVNSALADVGNRSLANVGLATTALVKSDSVAVNVWFM